MASLQLAISRLTSSPDSLCLSITPFSHTHTDWSIDMNPVRRASVNRKMTVVVDNAHELG